MKLKFCIIVSNINLYKKIVLTTIAQALWLLLQLQDSIDMGKVKIEIYWQHIADILTKVLQKYLLSRPPPSI